MCGDAASSAVAVPMSWQPRWPSLRLTQFDCLSVGV